MNSKKLIVFSAPSGAGKTTLVKYLLSMFNKIEFSISATSRKPRGKEKNGKDYYFLSDLEFKEKINTQKFVEYEEVYGGVFYGTLKSELNRIWDDNKIVIFDIDVEGGVNIKEMFPLETLSVFVMPPSLEILKKRLMSILISSNYKQIYIKRKNDKSYKLLMGPYNTIKKLKNDYIVLSDSNFEDLDIIIND